MLTAAQCEQCMEGSAGRVEPCSRRWWLPLQPRQGLVAAVFEVAGVVVGVLERD